MSDSSTGGYLAPDPTTAPLEDAAFDRFMQSVLVGITGMDGTTVFPRWQPDVPNLPAYGTNWAAIGVTDVRPDTYGIEIWDPDTSAYFLQRQEEITITASFYGPNARSLCSLFRDGLMIEQNRAALEAAGMALVETMPPVRVPVLQKERWLDRIDMRWVVRRAILRQYPVTTIASVYGVLESVGFDLVTEFDPIVVDISLQQGSMTLSPPSGLLAGASDPGAIQYLTVQAAPGTGALLAAGMAVPVAATPIVPGTAAIGLAALAPALAPGFSATLAPGSGALTGAGIAAGFSQALTTPSVVASLSGVAPVLLRGVGISPAAGAITAPATTSPVALGVTPIAGGIVFAGLSAGLSVSRIPTAGTLGVVGVAPGTSYAIVPVAGSVGFAGLSATLNPGTAPGTAALAALGVMPTIGARTLQPAAGAVSVAGVASVAGIATTPAAGSIGVVGQLSPNVLTPLAGAVSAAGVAAAASISVIPGAAALSASASASKIAMQVTPLRGALALATVAPTVVATVPNTTRQPNTGSIATAGVSGTSFGFTSIPPAGALVVLGKLNSSPPPYLVTESGNIVNTESGNRIVVDSV